MSARPFRVSHSEFMQRVVPLASQHIERLARKSKTRFTDSDSDIALWLAALMCVNYSTTKRWVSGALPVPVYALIILELLAELPAGRRNAVLARLMPEMAASMAQIRTGSRGSPGKKRTKERQQKPAKIIKFTGPLSAAP